MGNFKIWVYKLGIAVLPPAPTSVIHIQCCVGAEFLFLLTNLVPFSRIKILDDYDLCIFKNFSLCEPWCLLTNTLTCVSLLTRVSIYCHFVSLWGFH